MDKRPDIWFYLRDHETPPPPELEQRLHEALYGNGTLSRLQQEEIAPPVFLSEAIRSAVIGKRQRPFRRRFMYGSIAAALLLLLTGVTVYKTLFTGKANSPKENTIDKIKNAPIASARAADSLTSADTSRAATVASSENLPTIATDSAISAAMIKHDRSWALRVDGHSIRLVDNDPLFTLTSYHYPEIGNFLEQKAEEEIKISVDQYTNIVISKQAAAMIREMYKTRSNGKPTRKARKMKERLEYWKKADEKHFDGAGHFNPIDPIDLAEFIFK
jgi:hypothetical protein